MGKSLTETPLLQIRNLSVAFNGAEPVTRGVTFDLFKGTTTALLGESGSGKSITSSAIMGLLPKGGEVVDGTVTHLPSGQCWIAPNGVIQAPLGQGLSMVFQDPMSSLNPSMRVGLQVTEVLMSHQERSKSESRIRVEHLFEEVELPDPALTFNKYPHELSGGQKQRIMLAIALAAEPEVLIADEPTTALDVTVQQSILALLKKIQVQRGLAILFITHDLDVVRDIADTVLVLKDGGIVEQGPTWKVFLHPEHPYTSALLDAQTRPQRIFKAPGQKAYIEVQGVSKSFPVSRNLFGQVTDAFSAVRQVNATIYRGERVGLVGESGSGKSTLGRLILGLTAASEGSIMLDGQPVLADDRKSMKRTRRLAQLVFQDPYSALNPHMRIGSALEEVLMHLGENRLTAKKRAIALLEEVGLSEADAKRYPQSFSGGQRQRIVIARALAMEPEFLVLDESVAALDVQIQRAILDLLATIGDERQLTFLFISHDLGVVQSFCNRLLVMQHGQLVETGDTSEIMNNPQHPYTQELLSSRAGKRSLEALENNA
ncbi:ABC transporter ATP-binding protein [Flavobacteriales bacterium]|nr:ABC transporter ATP-binding protein [Flavobacteriales bacterium]